MKQLSGETMCTNTGLTLRKRVGRKTDRFYITLVGKTLTQSVTDGY